MSDEIKVKKAAKPKEVAKPKKIKSVCDECRYSYRTAPCRTCIEYKGVK